jgi:hypothetical protein
VAVAALVAAGLLLFFVLRSDGGPSTIDTSRAVAEHGSVRAIEYHDELAAIRAAMTRTVAEHGSIRAIEHRDQLAASDE